MKKFVTLVILFVMTMSAVAHASGSMIITHEEGMSKNGYSYEVVQAEEDDNVMVDIYVYVTDNDTWQLHEEAELNGEDYSGLIQILHNDESIWYGEYVNVEEAEKMIEELMDDGDYAIFREEL